MVSTALLTDHYELTALAAAIDSGVAEAPAVFEVFARRLPAGRGFGVVAGTGRFLDALGDFSFRRAELGWLVDTGVIDAAVAERLAGWRFEGSVHGYAEGDLYFPQSPVLRVSGRFGDALLLETLALSILNHDSAVASAAARMHAVAGGARLIEGGSRRTHEQAGVASARAAYLAGFDVTSNLEAGRSYGVPTGGTTMHAFTLAHPDERAAFDAQIARYGCDTTFLVDTYDIAEGIATAVAACAAAGGVPGAIRLDSGDPADTVPAARAQLDAAGARTTRIVVSGDLDEYEIDRLVTAAAPVDGFLAGTRLVTGSGHPTAGMVYKLVAIGDRAGGMRPVEKRAENKVSVGGAKTAWRDLDAARLATAEIVVADTHRAAVAASARPLTQPLVVDGTRVECGDVHDARARHLSARAELAGLDLSAAGPAIPTRINDGADTIGTRPMEVA